MKKGFIIGLLVLAMIIVIIMCRRMSFYDNSLVDYATQLMKERVNPIEILKALEAKGASQTEAFEIAKEAEKRLAQS